MCSFGFPARDEEIVGCTPMCHGQAVRPHKRIILLLHLVDQDAVWAWVTPVIRAIGLDRPFIELGLLALLRQRRNDFVIVLAVGFRVTVH